MSNPPYIKYRPPTDHQADSAKGRLFAMHQRLLLWLNAQVPAPTGYALDVPTCITMDRADLAAFWSEPRKIHKRTFLEPQRTMVIVCALSREECRAAGVNPDALYQELVGVRERIPRLEAQIRREEPELRDHRVLFEEYADWDYGHSQNPDYQHARMHCRELEEMLYRGTRLERILKNAVADECYLAVPQGTLLADEVMPGWGLLTIPPGNAQPIVVERPAVLQECIPEARMHLIQNMAQAATGYINAGHGLLER